MKNRKYFVTVIVFALFLFSGSLYSVFSQDARKALEYMNTIGAEYESISKDLWDYTSAVAHGKSARKVEKRRKELIGTTRAALNKAKRLPGFEGDKRYRDSVISYLTISDIVISQDYEKIVNMEEIAEQSYDKMEAYMMAQQIANDKLDVAGAMVNIEQKRFAADHNINLIENKDELSKKLDKAGLVFHHYNTVYLIFFKSFKEEAYLLDALGKNDVNAMEQNRNSLIRFSSEGMKTLDTLKPFKGDNSLKTACRQMLDFYNTEAATKITLLTGFYLKKDNFEKIKTSFDNKSQSDRTKEDVDLYNKAVNEFNLAVNEYNKTNQELNQKRSMLLDKWNQTIQSFLDRNVPKK